MKRFKALTLGHPVLMGRATFESIGRALPGRPNLVVTGDRAFKADGCEVYHDLDTASDRAKLLAAGLGKSCYFVIGGGQIYAQMMAEADRLEITHVHFDIEGDTQFPEIDESIWVLDSQESVEAGENDEADMTFATYKRRV